MGFFNFFKRDISEEEFQEQQKVKRGLEKTRTGFFQSIVNTLTNAQIDDDLYDQLEEQLILADVGPACAVRLVDELHDEVEEKHLKTGQEALDALRGIICQELTPRYPMELDGKPAVILVIGVNGVGKTTTIAKLAGLYKKQGRRVMLAAGDTFRAAASEQLELWAERAGVPLVQAGMGADPAAVIFDAVKSANARGYDMVIADTAGRLHNKKGLMDELSKISRSVKKASPEASLEVLLVLDAITGQNAISQAEEFCKRRQRHRRGADQARRHAPRRLRGLCVGEPRSAHPLHRRRREDRRPDGIRRTDLRRKPAARESALQKRTKRKRKLPGRSEA